MALTNGANAGFAKHFGTVQIEAHGEMARRFSEGGGVMARTYCAESATIRQRIRKHIAESYAAAQKLDTIGMAVILTEDNGQLTHTKLTSLPWTLGHGAWVVKVEGKSGGYDCARIRPAGKAVAR